MAEPHFKMESLNPKIESNVPGKQELREELQDNFVPVMKDNPVLVVNPVYSSVFSEAPVSQPLRSPHHHHHHHQNGEENQNGNDSKKSKSKIPTLKQTIEKIKEQRRKAKEQPNIEVDRVLQPQRPRRSSIPRLKKIVSKQNIDRKESNKDQNVENSEVEAKPKTEEEFDKLFEEIVKNDENLEIDDSILPDTPMDDEKLLNSFEEIIHAYDDNKMQPIVFEHKQEANKPRSKIPLSRKISHDAPKKPPRRSDRRNSLKVSSNADIDNAKIAYNKIKSEEQDAPKIEEPQIDISNGFVINSSGSNEVSSIKEEYKTSPIELQENLNPIIKKEIISLKVEETEIAHEVQTETIPEYQSSIIEQSVDTLYRDEIKTIKEKQEELIISTEPQVKEIPKEENQTKDIAINRKDSTEEDLPILKGKVSRIINRLHSREDIYDAKRDSVNNLPNKRSLSSRIAIFEQHETPSKLNTEIKPEKVPDIQICRKPKIIEEVLKTSPPTEDQIKTQNGRATYKKTTMDVTKTSTIVDVDKNSIFQSLISTYVTEDAEKLKTVDSNIAITETASREYTTVNNKTKQEIDNKITDTPKDDKENPVQHENDYLKYENIIENRMKRLKSITDIDNIGITRSKSIVDIELGKSIKGKVHHIIESMNVEKVSLHKEVINSKERPRKKSVMEKIALFERKLVPVEMVEIQKLPANSPPVNGNSIPDGAVNKKLAANTPLFNGNATDGAVEENYNLDVENEYRSKTEELIAARSKYGSVNEMPYIELKNGQKMPVLAVGTALLEPKLIKHIIRAAIDLGYRAIDVAFIYGTERPVGEAIREKILDGTVRREDLFIMSKLWSTFHHPELVEKACRASLETMGLDYFDLYMIHNPMSFKEGGDPIPTIANVLQYSDYEYLDAWFAMEKLVHKGLVKGIGLSNFNSSQVSRVNEKGSIKPLVNQVECHPYLNQERLITFCKTYDVAISCFGTLGSPGTPADYKSPGVKPVIGDPIIATMAAGMHITPAQMLIRYQLERGHNVVVKASSAAHLWENIQSLHCRLTQNEVEALHLLNKNKRNFSFIGMGDTHKNYPFKDSF
ncbi:uncharacterized protein LOC105392607 isoform X2 [Plutella xylostella]|nr:uncharacterized protein LOC105392607 isoform X2 [Plutella xylostella]XP_048485830.1 uncharacterized protein LOC105392607 isoform X2 [Plutella xylostella]XP_048485831.1 uncharacterized protein LOC105392607 isoform X2 [Plutella xylostella]